MSTPASRPWRAASAASAATRCWTISPTPSQSLTIAPSNPHSSFRMSRRYRRFACTGTPSMSLKLDMTVATPARTQSWNGRSCRLRRLFSPAVTEL